MIKSKSGGATLIEVLIACAVFSLLVLCLFAVMKYATNSWRNVEDRVSVQSEIRKIQTSLTEDLRKTSYASVITYTGDYRHAIAFKTFINPYTGKFETGPSGDLISQGYVLFFLMRPKGDTCGHSALATTDNKCPHKVLVRVDLTRTTDGTNSWAPITFPTYSKDSEAAAASNALKAYLPSDLSQFYFRGTSITADEYKATISGETKYVENVYIIGKNLLSFNVEKKLPPNNPEVLVDIKCFKMMSAGIAYNPGTQDLDTNQFTIQVDNRVIPMNP
ncbi:MAG: prepilin-type N-terminal cleavage/methylation domain-containing protein [Firmicutes bacterium]|nr:prepilin-type N-terminal cleavage/methylation domain-containing protein [Bacillota bacterium]